MSDPDLLKKRLSKSLVTTVGDLNLKFRHRPIGWLFRPFRRTVNRLGERIFRLDTAKKEVEPHHFHPERAHYQPSGWLYLRRGLRGHRVGPDDVFVDFGSGKGRVLCQAARYPFARVVGVEISAGMTEVARSNVDRNRGRFACQEIELVTADVLEFHIPDDLTVAYFFYPFMGKTFEHVIDGIVESIERRPRRVTIIYALPALEDYILGTGRFRLARTSRGGWRNFLFRRVSVYVHDPEPG